jgi:hypothetical protein
VPLVTDTGGARLEKRNPRHTLRGLRQAGVAPGAVIARLARALGWETPAPELAPADLLGRFDLAPLRRARLELPA